MGHARNPIELTCADPSWIGQAKQTLDDVFGAPSRPASPLRPVAQAKRGSRCPPPSATRAEGARWVEAAQSALDHVIGAAERAMRPAGAQRPASVQRLAS